MQLYKGKEDVKECGNYRGIKLMSHIMKLWERAIYRLKARNKVTIAEQQFGFMSGRSTTDTISCLRMLMEKWSNGQKAMHCVFIDLEKRMIEYRLSSRVFHNFTILEFQKPWGLSRWGFWEKLLTQNCSSL